MEQVSDNSVRRSRSIGSGALLVGKREELKSMGIGGTQWNEYELEWSKGGIDRSKAL
jgi:hypothetical protein